MNWIRAIIERIQATCSAKRAREAEAEKWRAGYHAYEMAEVHFREDRLEQALDCLDKAIVCGYEEADVFSMRGSCLQSLGYDLDAIDDFDKAIMLGDTDCNTYYMRAHSKRYGPRDLDGCIRDLQEAIRLSQLPTELNREHDEFARSNGWGSNADYYIQQLVLRPT
jgi:tetratricopeptide (TPR) repeat protein